MNYTIDQCKREIEGYTKKLETKVALTPSYGRDTCYRQNLKRWQDRLIIAQKREYLTGEIATSQEHLNKLSPPPVGEQSLEQAYLAQEIDKIRQHLIKWIAFCEEKLMELNS